MKLYKYKKVIDDGYLFFRDMLEKEYLYCSEVDKFDDVFDGKLPIEEYKFKETTELENDEELNKFIIGIICEENSYIDRDRYIDFENVEKKLDDLLKNTDISKVTSDSEYFLPLEEELKENEEMNKNLSLFLKKEIVLKLKKCILTLYNFQKKARICSLARDYNNPVLWAMYGDDYKGACIEYEIDDSLSPKEVEYGNREIYDPITFIMQKIKNNEDIKSEELKYLIEKLFRSKNDRWSFQNEYRILSLKEKIPCKINTVYFGKYIPENYKNIIYEEYKEKYKFFDMKIDNYNQIIKFVDTKIKK